MLRSFSINELPDEERKSKVPHLVALPHALVTDDQPVQPVLAVTSSSCDKIPGYC